ncbi:tannase and feruloyl esterase [Thozetella sp. PMI_491]|nr:tannase and feruloyl esterase [Thozetella sp. PMI_491]
MAAFLASTFLSLLSVAAARVTPDSCSGLQRQHPDLPENVSFNTSWVAPGALQIGSTSYNNTQSLCRVVGVVKYGCKRNSTLNFEVWLPDESQYNRRYLSVGNGGFAGNIEYGAMLTNLNSGYAVGGCDSGHPLSENGETVPGSFVAFQNNRAETLAWIHNSIAMFTDPAKKLVASYYGTQPNATYFSGCSTGGAQGFALAQYHPTMFDGIHAGSPGNWYSHLMLSFLWNGVNSNDSKAFFDQDALNFVTNAILDACDTIDGVEDRLLDDPTKCTFDIASLLCAEGQAQVVDNSTVCLSPEQVDNAKKFYAGPIDVRNGKQAYPGFALGSEVEWMLQEVYLQLAYAVPVLQNLAFKNLSYDYTTFNWGSDIDIVDQQASPLIDAISPDLRAFHEHGGKMIVLQGWADPFNAPFWPIQQRDQMLEIFQDDLSSFFSLFMVPGGGHCGAATTGYQHVPAVYHVLDRLVSWVEGGDVPQDLLTTDPPDGGGSTRTLLPYM